MTARAASIVTLILTAGITAQAQTPTAPTAHHDPAALGREFNDAYRAKDWKHAAELGQRLAKLTPDNATLHYNLACVQSLGGNLERALASLTKAGDLGFANLETLDGDTDLDSARNDAAFAAIRDRVRTNRQQARATFLKKAAKAEPIIVLPEGVRPKRPSPVIVALHGFGGSAERFEKMYRKVAAELGAILVVPRAVHPTDGGGTHWGSFEDADYLVTRALERVRKRYNIDQERVLLTGFSQGGFMSFRLGLSQPGRFRGVVSVAGSYRSAFLNDAARKASEKARFYMMVGAADGAYESNRLAMKELSKAGFDAHVEIYEGVGHTYPENSRRELRRAFDWILGGKPTS